MDGHSGFKNIIPILKNKDMLPLLYKLKDQVSLEKFLIDNKINLSLEEIEKLWDVIDICKPYYFNSNHGKDSNQKSKSGGGTPQINSIEDETLNVSGGTDIFCDKIYNILNLLGYHSEDSKI